MKTKALILAAFFGVFLGLAAWTAAGQESGEFRTVRDSYGRDVEIPRIIVRTAPVIPAFCQVTEMLTRGGGKVAAYPAAG
ncbi:MAG: hypothetical protein LBK52_06445, partial [Deltaproteobacteria bacterium]|nr:hypothetical protein [Deltaproteobacteria bacterium]